jgi:putative transposase
MDGSVSLGRADRKRLLDFYRRSPDSAVRLRAHIILLLSDGFAWATIAAVLLCSTRTIARWKRRFEAGGLDALLPENRGRRRGVSDWIITTMMGWVIASTPREFGFLRSRWSCGTLVLVMVEVYHFKVSAETVRRWLREEGLVWRRPRPVLKPKDPERKKKLRRLRKLLRNLPPEEIAVFEDEVDINTNPKIGSMWMFRGQQAEVETPGTNEKRYVAGSLNWRTGDVILTEGLPKEGRSSALFVRHLDDLRYRLRRYRKIHVICDNAIFHDPERCGRIKRYQAEWGDRIELHFLPKYDPQSNPTERVWWHLHEEITRNHRCQTMEELMDLVFAWLDNRVPFEVERHVYEPKRAA